MDEKTAVGVGLAVVGSVAWLLCVMSMTGLDEVEGGKGPYRVLKSELDKVMGTVADEVKS